jgi:hypothetical protein
MQDRFTELYGANAFDDPRNYDTAGNFKPRRLQFADSAAQPQARVRGYAFADVASGRSQDAAAEAYESKRAYLRDAWRKDTQDNANQSQDAAQAKGLADSAWQDKKQRLANAWRGR